MGCGFGARLAHGVRRRDERRASPWGAVTQSSMPVGGLLRSSPTAHGGRSPLCCRSQGQPVPSEADGTTWWQSRRTFMFSHLFRLEGHGSRLRRRNRLPLTGRCRRMRLRLRNGVVGLRNGLPKSACMNHAVAGGTPRLACGLYIDECAEFGTQPMSNVASLTEASRDGDGSRHIDVREIAGATVTWPM